MFKITLVPKGVPAGFRKRDYNAAKKIAFGKLGEYWFKHFRPKHFTKAGAREYGYIKRKGEDLPHGSKGFRASYTGRKFKKFGHKQPLVYTGESREASRKGRVKPTSKGVQIIMRAPRLNRRNPNSQIKPSDELTIISSREWKVLEGIFDVWLESELQKVAKQGSRRVA